MSRSQPRDVAACVYCGGASPTYTVTAAGETLHFCDTLCHQLWTEDFWLRKCELESWAEVGGCDPLEGMDRDA